MASYLIGRIGSRLLGSHASYSDSRRESIPPVLANNYLACKSSFQRLWTNGAKLLQVPNTQLDYNQLFAWGPAFNPSEFLTETFHQAMIACYEEFRVRCVKVTLHSMHDASTNTHKCPVWIWYPENHTNLVPTEEIGNYTDMLESGERFRKIGNSIDDTLTMRAIPQTIIASGDGTSGVYKDVPSPWQATSAANLNMSYYMPYFVWRMAYESAEGISANYQITFSAIIEFRSPRDSQL